MATDTVLAFDPSGELIGDIPTECVEDCSHSGQCYPDVEYWVRRLSFDEAIEPVLGLARDYLREFGAWDDLDDVDVETIAQRVLWLACCDISERSEWFGLVY